MIDGWGIFCVIAPGWSSPNLTDDKSTSAHVMAWCHHLTNHYLNQCCPSSISPYGITMPQCVYQHIPQHHIPQHQYELKLNKMVAKIWYWWCFSRLFWFRQRCLTYLTFQNYICMNEMLQSGWLYESKITMKCFLSDYICLRLFIHSLPQ